MKFLSEQSMTQLFQKAHPKLFLVVADAEYYCRTNFDKHLVITSVIRGQTNDSGVHAVGRGCDIRVRNPDTGEALLSEVQQIKLCQYLNKKYIYGSGRLTAMIHRHGLKTVKPSIEMPIFESSNATGPHIHLQVPASQ
jgi:hypothetical protein